MKKFKHFETESGNTIKVAQFDGYLINERSFEGLMFQVEIQDDGSLKAYVKPSDEDYFSDFNQEKWLKVATDFAYEYDIFEDPKTGEECWLIDTDGKSLYGSEGDETDEGSYPQKIKKAPIKIGVSNTMDKLNQIFGSKKEESEEKPEEVEEVKESVIGKFKPNRKFLNFISGNSAARVRFIRETAFIDGNQLSGILEGVKFKITICDEGTIDFEEVDTNQCDESMIKRLIESIDEMEVTGYTQKFVVANLEFKDKDGVRCYLEVEHQKPIEKFASILDIFKEEEESARKTEVSDKGLSILDDLFSSESEEELEREFEGENVEVIKTEEDAEIFVENITNVPAPNEKLKTATESYLEESFRKMNEAKINELKNRIDTNKKEIFRVRSEIKQSESKLDKMLEDTGVLETRLESMYGNEDPIGFVFNVSEEQKPEDIGLSEENRQIADKIADIVGLKKDVLFNMLTEGFYKIRIAPKDSFDSKEFEIGSEVLERLTSIDLMGKFKRTETVGEFEYRGEMNWHQLVSKMIKKGFEQEPEFDKLCLSNSYDSKWSPSNENGEVESVEETNNSNIEFGDVEPINVRTFNKPTNLVIVGASNDSEDIKITDDLSSFEVFIGDKLHNGYYVCDRFVSIMKVEQYKKWLSEQDLEPFSLKYGIISCIYIPDFQGTIGVVAKTNDGDFTTDFDVNDYICHQIDCYNVYLTLPEGTTLIEMEDGKIPVSVLRDIKINNIL